MATLEKIRSKGILLLVVVGAALVIFIVGDLVNSGSSYFNESSANVAQINGENVKIRDYAMKIDQFNDVVRMEYGSNLNDEMTEQIRQMVWDNTVNENVIGNECGNIGMTITKNELADMIIGNNISPILRNNRMFVNENGVFDVNMLKHFLSTIDNEETANSIPYDELQRYRNYWKYWEHTVKSFRLQEKYNNLLAKAMNINPLEAKYAYNNSKVSGDAVYAMKNYFAIPDSTISVSDSEIKKLYNKKKNQYKQKEGADIQYITVAIKPSAEDFAEVRNWISDLKEEFATANDIADITNSYSDTPYRAENLTKDQIDEDFQEFAFSGKEGDVMGPIFTDNTYKMARIVEQGISSPDSVKLSHIYLRADSKEKVQSLADSIQQAVKAGASFADLAKEHSIGQTAANGGEIGWLSEMGLDKKIAEPAFSTPAKGMFQIQEGNDINLFYVEAVGKKTEKVKIAILSRIVDASSRTRTELYNKAKQYIVENNTLETFRANARKSGYSVSTASDVNINANSLNDLKQAREIVRWAFENEEGTISDVFEVGENIVMAAVSKRSEEGYRPIEEIRPMLISEIRKDKKGDILIKEMEGKSINELSVAGFRTDTVRNISFASNYAGSIGNEPQLFALIGNAELNKESAPIKGNSGAFVFTVIDKKESAAPYNEKEEIVMLSTKENYMLQYQALEALKKAAEIKDMRYKYY